MGDSGEPMISTDEEFDGGSSSGEKLHPTLPVEVSAEPQLVGQLAICEGGSDYCAGCGKSLSRGRKYSLAGTENTSKLTFIQNSRERRFESRLRSSVPSSRSVLESDFICSSCHSAFYRQRQESTFSPSASTLELSIRRCSATHARCVFGCTNSNVFIIPQAVRDKVLIKHRFYIPEGSRCCAFHLQEDMWDSLPSTEGTHSFNNQQIEDMVDSLRKASISDHILNFEFLDDIPDSLVEKWVGLKKVQFQEFLTMLPSLHIEERKHTNTALALFLSKLRTGESNERLASLFNIPRSSAERLMNKARAALLTDFVPNNLGFSRLDRNLLLTHNTPVAKALFCNSSDDRLVTICDGTYVYIQKSANNSFQRKSYSMHKHRNLLKPFLIVAPDGHILDIFGPYSGNTSDAQIMVQLFSDGAGLRSFFNTNDVFLVDRGFRDSVSKLEEYGYRVHMPSFLSAGHSQLSTAQANESRLVTKCRFIVEVVNGRLKQCFRYFDKVWCNKSVDHLMSDFRIAGSILNAFYEGIESDKNDGVLISQQMLARLREPNLLASLVEAQNLNRKSATFLKMAGNSLVEFPLLTINDLYFISLGSYQIRQAMSYCAEHMNADGSFEVQLCRHVGPLRLSSVGIAAIEPFLIRGRIQSRHQSRTKYMIYVLVDQSKAGAEAIAGHYCQCKNGQRTVGCCAHIMTVLWYLGYGRHQPKIPEPAKSLNDLCVVLESTDDECPA